MSNFGKNKRGNIVQRTTSETLRLEDLLGNSINRALPPRKTTEASPNCSFQITGVSLTKGDLGDDSADDLDESHTEDISKMTDETPSFSEDSHADDHQVNTYSKPDLFARSAQTPGPSESVFDENETRTWEVGRFKVRKLEPKPVTKGRWICFDFSDKPENNPNPAPVCDGQGNAPIYVPEVRPTKTVTFQDEITHEVNFDGENVSHAKAFFDINCQGNYPFCGSVMVPQRPATPFPVNFERPLNTKARLRDMEGIVVPKPMRCYKSAFVHAKPPIDDEYVCPSPAFNMFPPRIEEPKDLSISSRDIVVVDSNSNSEGASTISCTSNIDSKIEHALDVVKNHLTHAVRIEVEELKQKINELVNRVSCLEYENDVLRANVAPEVLANLNRS